MFPFDFSLSYICITRRRARRRRHDVMMVQKKRAHKVVEPRDVCLMSRRLLFPSLSYQTRVVLSSFFLPSTTHNVENRALEASDGGNECGLHPRVFLFFFFQPSGGAFKAVQKSRVAFTLGSPPKGLKKKKREMKERPSPKKKHLSPLLPPSPVVHRCRAMRGEGN